MQENWRRYVDLSQEEMELLSQLEGTLPYFSELTNADLFLDCMTLDGESAIVVAHAKPEGSLYRRSIVGEIVRAEKEPAVFRAFRTGLPVRDLKGVTQENRMVKQYTTPVKNREGKIFAVLVQERDVTSKIVEGEKLRDLAKTTEQLTEALVTREGNPNLVTNHVSDGVVIFDGSLRAVYLNPEAQNIYRRLGFGERLMGMTFDDLSLDYRGDSHRVLQGEVAMVETTVGETTLRIRYKVPQQGSETGVVMLLEDITDVRQKERELILKSVVVQEMHHRIKNNLQTIASILSLQARRSTSPETVRALQESMNRIRSIAAIHEILCRSGVGDRLGLLDLIERIRQNLLSLASGEQQLSIQVSGDPVQVDNDQAVAIAIVINELVTNSIVHGFEGRRSGSVWIQVERGRFYHTVTIQDDGVGYDVHRPSTGRLGLEIVRATVKDKLHGTLMVTVNNIGTCTVFDFRNEDTQEEERG